MGQALRDRHVFLLFLIYYLFSILLYLLYLFIYLVIVFYLLNYLSISIYVSGRLEHRGMWKATRQCILHFLHAEYAKALMHYVRYLFFFLALMHYVRYLFLHVFIYLLVVPRDSLEKRLQICM